MSVQLRNPRLVVGSRIPVWWNTGTAFNIASVLAILPYRGCYPQISDCILELTGRNQSVEMSYNSADFDYDSRRVKTLEARPSQKIVVGDMLALDSGSYGRVVHVAKGRFQPRFVIHKYDTSTGRPMQCPDFKRCQHGPGCCIHTTATDRDECDKLDKATLAFLAEEGMYRE